MAVRHTSGGHMHRCCCHVCHRTVGHHWHVIMLGRWRRFILEHTKLIFFGFEVFVAVGADFTIRTRFVCAAMPGMAVRVIRSTAISFEHLLGQVV